MSENLLIDQQVIHNNKEIFNKIEAELKLAEFEIQVATAWFTDDILFDILLDKAANGVKVEVIIADNSDNERLDFNTLMSKGALVLKVKNVGYGMMHQKFCIIDRKKALHGSYNWSNNAKNNNHESIIVTNHKETVESLVLNFNNIKERAIAISLGEDVSEVQSKINIQQELKNIDESQIAKSDYEKVLDSMIAAEVSSFNRENLRTQGFDRGQANNGDHQVLNKALDTLYNGFINDIDVIEDKKRRLISKIDEQKAKTESNLIEKCELQIETLKEANEIQQNNLENKIVNFKSELLVGESAINEFKENAIPHLKNKIIIQEKSIKESLIAFARPSIRWFELITTSFIGFGLFIYLIMFYSSAAYILLYSETDVIIASKTSSETIPPQVFEPDAFNKAWNHGGGAMIFMCLFVLIPITFSVLSRILENKKVANWITYTLGIGVIDTFIAIKVSEAIANINLQTNKSIVPWNLWNVIYDINFYLVFVLGAFGLIAFKFCFEKISRIIDERNPDLAAQRNKVSIQQKIEEITALEEDIFDKKSAIEKIERENIIKKTQINSLENELSNLPLKISTQIENRKNDLSNKLQVIDTTTVIYKSHIENDNIPVSIDALKDRINIFLEGWNDYLHQEYSIIKASEKSADATEIALNWEFNKLNKSSIDSRVKIR